MSSLLAMRISRRSSCCLAATGVALLAGLLYCSTASSPRAAGARTELLVGLSALRLALAALLRPDGRSLLERALLGQYDAPPFPVVVMKTTKQPNHMTPFLTTN